MNEHPQGQSIQQDAHEENNSVDGREHQLCRLQVSGAPLRPVEALHPCHIRGFQCHLCLEENSAQCLLIDRGSH